MAMNADEVRTLLLNIEVNSDELDKIKEEAEKFDEPIFSSLFKPEDLDAMKKAFEDASVKALQLQKVTEAIALLEKQDPMTADIESALEALTAMRDELEKGVPTDSFRNIHTYMTGAAATTERLRREFEDLDLHVPAAQAKQLRDDFVSLNYNAERMKDIAKEISSLKLINSEAAKKEIANLKKEMQSLYDQGGLIKQLKEAGSSTMDWLGKKALSILSSIGNKIKTFITDTFTSAWEEAAEAASYDFANSLVSNTEARETALQYGLSGAQTWAYDKVSDLLGITSEEDLYYMSESQREAFIELMDKYTAKYEEYSESGVFQEIQEFTLEWEEFKLDMQVNLISWFSENKDLIKSVLEGLMSFMQWIVTAVGDIVKFISNPIGFTFSNTGSAATSASVVSDYITNAQTAYSNSSSSTTTTNNNNQSYNPVFNITTTSATSDEVAAKYREWYMSLSA